MFTVGEFARLAQISARSLRYYDEIGLLEPAHVDAVTDYRYYRADQLPLLNRILALKDLGFSLDEIGTVLRDDITVDELEGMLVLKRAEVERRRDDEQRRIRAIESRLRFIRDLEGDRQPDVVVKSAPATAVVSLRTVVADFAAASVLFARVLGALPDTGPYGPPFGIWHRGGPYEHGSDTEMGRLLHGADHGPVALPGGLVLRCRQLPAVPSMATFVLRGPNVDAHLGYSAIGTWAEVNRFRFAGPPREMFLHVDPGDGESGVTELQYPVEPITG